MTADDTAEVQRMIDAGIDKLATQLAAQIATAIATEWDGFTIQKGQNTTISGTGKNITIGFDPPTWTGTALCDGEGGITLTIKSN